MWRQRKSVVFLTDFHRQSVNCKVKWTLHLPKILYTATTVDTSSFRSIAERVLGALGLNLELKARVYEAPTLSCLFLLNNYNYIVKSGSSKVTKLFLLLQLVFYYVHFNSIQLALFQTALLSVPLSMLMLVGFNVIPKFAVTEGGCGEGGKGGRRSWLFTVHKYT